MRLNAPSFWYPQNQKTLSLVDKLKSAALWPLAAFYQMAHRLNMARHTPYESAIPVICAGNLTAGGTGKTPTVLALMDVIKHQLHGTYKNPAFLTRGFGGIEDTEPALVDSATTTAKQTGDEALLLARAAPTIRAKNRANGARFGEAQGFDVLLMDDGLQNNTLAKNLSFCVIDGLRGFGNGLTIPAGPLRESLHYGFAKCDAFILIGEDLTNAAAQLPQDKPLFRAQFTVRTEDMPDKTKRYLGFAGIGNPEKFRKTLEEIGLEISHFAPFPDHYDYSAQDLAQLADLAEARQCALITTEKDFVRLPQDFIARHGVKPLPVRLAWQESDEHAIKEFVSNYLENTVKTARNNAR